MFDIRDPSWQFILGVSAIALSIVIYLLQRRQKSLNFGFGIVRLVSVEKIVKEKITILYDGKPANDVHLVMVKIFNSGNITIDEKDFVRPFAVDFGDDSEILSAEIKDTNPNNLGASISIEGTKIIFNPLMLNGGDWVKINVLVNSPKNQGQFKIDGRIAGVKEIYDVPIYG